MPPIDTVQGSDDKSLQIPPHDTQGDTGTSDDSASHSQPKIQQAAATAQNAARSLFGIPQHGPQVRGNDLFDYEQRFPEDKRNEELGPSARVWRTYREESGTFDIEMLEGWKDGINVLLVFAGLFSAVVTTFVARTSQSLQVDYDQTTATLLLELINLQRALANGSPVNDIPRSDLTLHHTTSDSWVNGLWFTSLTLSLVTAIFAVLTKQWIYQYITVPSGTPRDRCRVRHFRYMGLQQWGVGFIIGLLPVLLSVSLGLFLVGLVLFLAPLQMTIAYVVGAFTSMSFVAYFVSNILPIFFLSCPYKTPLSHYTFLLYAYTVHSARDFFPSVISSSSTKLEPPIRTLQDAEQSAVKSNADDLAVQALSWLFNMSSNPSVQSIVVQSIGALPLASVESLKQHAEGISELCNSTLTDSVVSPLEEGTFDRLARASLRLGPIPHIRTMNIREQEKERLSSETYAMLLAISSDYPFGEDPEIRSLVEAQFMESIDKRLVLQPILWNRLLQKALPLDISSLVDRDDRLIQLLFHAIPSSYWRADYKAPSLFNGSDGLKICSTFDGGDCSLGRAIVDYLYPFVADFFLCDRNAEGNFFHDPTDKFPASQEPRLCALLAMAASPSIQRVAVIDPSIHSLFGTVVLNIRTYMDVHGFHLFDDKIPSFGLDANRQTVLKLLFNLVSSNTFGSASMRSFDQRITLVTFLRVLISTSENPLPANWCTSAMASTFVRIAFQDKTWTLQEEDNHPSHYIWLNRLESDELILYFLRFAPTMNQVFSRFVSGRHLDKIGNLRGRDLLSHRHLPEVLDNFIIRMTPNTVRDHRTFQQYIFEPENLFTICAVHICGKNPSFLRHLAEASPKGTEWSRCWRKLDTISEHFGLQLSVSPGWILHIISEFREFVEGQCTGSFGLDTPDLQPPQQALTGDEHPMNERSLTRLWHRLRPWKHRNKVLTTEEIMMNRSRISQA